MREFAPVITAVSMVVLVVVAWSCSVLGSVSDYLGDIVIFETVSSRMRSYRDDYCCYTHKRRPMTSMTSILQRSDLTVNPQPGTERWSRHVLYP
jgi:hypothetical protein